MRKTKPTSTEHSSSSEGARAVNRAALTAAIEKQRDQLSQVQAIAGGLGVAIQEGYDALELDLVTHVIVSMLDDAIEALEPGCCLGGSAERVALVREGARRQAQQPALDAFLSTGTCVDRCTEISLGQEFFASVVRRLRSRRSPLLETLTQRLPPPNLWLCSFALGAQGSSNFRDSASARRTTLIRAV